jgi:hypothetical protein
MIILHVGDLVKCINDENVTKFLTTGKIYKVLNVDYDYFIRVRDDDNRLDLYYRIRFVKVSVFKAKLKYLIKKL